MIGPRRCVKAMGEQLQGYMRLLEWTIGCRNGAGKHARSQLDVLRSLTDAERERLEAGIIPHMARIRRLAHPLKIKPDDAKEHMLGYLRWRDLDARET